VIALTVWTVGTYRTLRINSFFVFGRLTTSAFNLECLRLELNEDDLDYSGFLGFKEPLLNSLKLISGAHGACDLIFEPTSGGMDLNLSQRLTLALVWGDLFNLTLRYTLPVYLWSVFKQTQCGHLIMLGVTTLRSHLAIYIISYIRSCLRHDTSKDLQRYMKLCWDLLWPTN
jgi:hypothetical protein